MQHPYSISTEDPDYRPTNEENCRENVSQSLLEQDAKEHSVQKIRSIIHRQFSLEVHLKEREIELIDQRIGQTRAMLDRLRACVLARYYGTSTKPQHQRNDLMSSGKRSSKRRCVETCTSAHDNSSTDTSVNTRRDLNTNPRANGDTSKVRDTSTRNNSTKLNSHPWLSTGETTQTVCSLVAVNNEVSRIGNKVPRTENTPEDNPNVNQLTGLLMAGRDFGSTTNNQLSNVEGVSEKKSDIVGLGDSIASPAENSQSYVTQIKLERGISVGGEQLQANGRPQGIPENLSNAEPDSKLRVMEACLAHTGSRFYVKKRVIVGNTSKYIPLEGREASDRSTHKWMVYVRGPPEDPRIDLFIKKVWFFLHPSYRPNDIVEVNRAPFHLTRRGWGEFPIRAQLHFVNSRNKRVDIFHELKLDRTYTGLQTLGAETVVDLELDRKTFEDLGIPFASSPRESTSTLASSTSVNASESRFTKDDNKLNDFTEVKRKHRSNSTEQIPQLKKIKLEEATWSDVSAFSSLASTPISSQQSSRCASPETTPVSIHKFCEGTEEALHKGVKMYPLINPERNLARFPYCALSLEQFWGWNIGKRRAAEWQRALALRRHVQWETESRDLSTRGVMFWCRRYGFTPCHSPSGKCWYCKICGSLIGQETESEDAPTGASAIHEDCIATSDSFITLSSGANLLLSLEEREETLPGVAQGSDDEEEVEVDVVGEIPQKKAALRKPESPVYSLPLALEEEWVREACSDIGVNLEPVNFEGVGTHAVEGMLWSACKQLIEDILRHAWAFAADQSGSCGSRFVIPSHVHGAVGSLPTCDFLRNSYLGAVEGEGDVASGIN